MTEYVQALQIFQNYLEAIASTKGSEEITNDDIDEFLQEFLDVKKQYFTPTEGFYTPLRTGNAVDPTTDEKAFDMTGKSYQEASDELRPILVKAVQDTYGSISSKANARMFVPTPKSKSDYAFMVATDMGISEEEWVSMPLDKKVSHPATIQGEIRAQQVKSNIKQYFDKVLPFMARKTMHHPIGTGMYSTTKGSARLTLNDGNGNPITLNSEEELQKFLSVKRYPDNKSPFIGGKHDGFRYLFWRPSTNGKNIKMAVLDIDNPAKLPHAEVVSSVKRIVSVLEDSNHPSIIMYTGGSFQIWIGDGDTKLGDMQDAKEYLTQRLYPVVSGDRDRAVIDKKVWLDPSTLHHTQQIRMFFSLHYPTEQSTATMSGLAAVPVPVSELDNFEPTRYAHPTVVAENFDDYARLVSEFFDTVQIGQDYESEGDTETAPEPVLLDGNYKDYEKLELLYSEKDYKLVKPSDIVEKIGGEEHVFAYTPARGVDTILEYRENGGFKFGGKKLTVSSTIGGSATIEPIRCVLTTRTGLVIHSDYITRDIERYCEAAGISELTIVGQIVLEQSGGRDADESDVLDLLVNSDEDSLMSRRFHFISNYIASFNKDTIPLTSMQEELFKINTNRVTPGPAFDFTKPVGKKLNQQYESIRADRRGNRMVVLGEKKYFVSPKQTIKMVVMGVSKESKAYQLGSDAIGPVFVGLMKRTSKHGNVYHLVGKASMALTEDKRKKLKELVYGEELPSKDDETVRYTNVIPINLRGTEPGTYSQLNDQIEIVEPKVVVEVEYDDISNVMNQTLAFHYTDDRGRKAYRAITNEKLKWANKLINMKVKAIREDYNPEYLSDVDYRQEPLMKISATVPTNQNIGISLRLLNPINDYDLRDHKVSRLGEQPNFVNPYIMSAKAYKRFQRIAKKQEVIGYVRKKSFHYEPYSDWALFGQNDDFSEATFSVVTINQDFRLRGIDVINTTQLCANYGVEWHLIIDPTSFWWINCKLENPDFQLRRDNRLAGAKDKKIKKALEDLTSAISTIYPPKDEVTNPQDIPGFTLNIVAMDMIEVRRNPAFFGVPQKLNAGESMYETRVDTYPLPEGDERLVQTKYGWIPTNYYGGRRIYPSLGIPTPRERSQIASGGDDIPEFYRAYERFRAADRGELTDDKRYKLFVDDHFIVKGKTGDYNMVTNLPFDSQNAIDDPRGYGADGIRTVTMARTLSEMPFQEQMDNHNNTNVEQANEDLKLTMGMLDRTPGDPDSSSAIYRREDVMYKREMNQLDKLDKSASEKKVPFGGLEEEIERLNPPVKQDSWDALVDNYTKAYEEWDKDNEAKESWDNYSKGMFPIWAVTMLEKERNKRKYELSEEEVNTINSTFGEDRTGGFLESTLGDLFEAEVSDEDAGFEEFDPDDTDEFE